MKKFKFMGLILIILLAVVAVSGCIGGGDDSNDGKNITLIKESTSGWYNIYDDETISVYNIEGVFKGLPSNVDGYNLRISLYEDGNLVKEDDGFLMEKIAKSSKDSYPSTLAIIGVDGYKHVDVAELKIYNKEGEIVFDQNVTIKQENMETNHITESTSENNDNSKDLDEMTYDEFNDWVFDDKYWDSA